MDYPVKKNSYWSVIKSTFNSIFKSAKIEQNPVKVKHGASWDKPQGATPTFDPLNALAAFAVHSYTHAAASRAAQDLAALPLKILKGTGANTQIIDTGPAVDLFNEPSTNISPFDFREQLEIDLMLTGNSYILLLGPNENAPTSMVRLHPAEVKIITTSTDGIVAFEHNSDGVITRYETSRVIHTKTASYQKGSSSVYGTSPIEALKGDISADLNAMNLASQASSKGRPDILLSPSDPSDIWTKEQRQEILQSYLGLASQGGALCLSGAISLQELKLSPRDLEYAQSRKFAMENVSAVLGVSPSVMGRPDANYATAKSQAVEYWNNQVKRAKRMAFSFTRIVKRFDPELRVEYDFSGVEALQEVRTERLKRIKEHVLLGMPVELAYKYENMEDAPINLIVEDRPIPDPATIGDEEDDNNRAYHRIKIPTRYDHIDFFPTKGVIAELQKGLKWHRQGHSGDGLKPATVNWATRLVNGAKISPDKVRRMRAWLARHESDKRGRGFYPGEVGYPSPGRVAWALWGGDPAKTWSNKIIGQMEKADSEKKYINPVLKAVEDPIISTQKPRTKRDMIWYNWIAKAHGPQEQKMYRVIKKYFAEASKRYAKRVRNQVKEQKSINGNLVIKSVTDWTELLAQEIEEKYLLEIAAFDWANGFMTNGLEVLEDLYKRAGIRLDLVELPQSSRQIAQYEVEKFAKRVTKTTANTVQAIVEKSISQGVPVIEMATAIEMSKAFSFDRAFMIARTETTKQLNSSASEAFKQGAANGVKMQRQWLSARDEDVRDSHIYLNDVTINKPVGVNELFVGEDGATTDHPGGFGIAKEDINCRCTIIPVFKD